MRYILIKDDDVIIKNSLSAIKKQLKAEFKEEQFKQIGNCKVATVTERDLEIAMDAKQMMNIPAHKLFKRETNTIYFILGYVMILIGLLQGCVK